MFGRRSVTLEWSYDEYRDGKWTQGYVAAVTSFDMNPAFSPADFDPSFPPGTEVEDKLLSDVGLSAWKLDETRRSLAESIAEEVVTPAKTGVGSTASAVSPSTAAGPAAPAPAPLPAAAPGWRDRLRLVATLVAPIAFIVLIAWFFILRRRR